MTRKRRVPKARVDPLPSPAWTFCLLTGAPASTRIAGWVTQAQGGCLRGADADEVWAQHPRRSSPRPVGMGSSRRSSRGSRRPAAGSSSGAIAFSRRTVTDRRGDFEFVEFFEFNLTRSAASAYEATAIPGPQRSPRRARG